MYIYEYVIRCSTNRLIGQVNEMKAAVLLLLFGNYMFITWLVANAYKYRVNPLDPILYRTVGKFNMLVMFKYDITTQDNY